jgi:hypothetical protein
MCSAEISVLNFAGEMGILVSIAHEMGRCVQGATVDAGQARRTDKPSAARRDDSFPAATFILRESGDVETLAEGTYGGFDHQLLDHPQLTRPFFWHGSNGSTPHSRRPCWFVELVVSAYLGIFTTYRIASSMSTRGQSMDVPSDALHYAM